MLVLLLGFIWSELCEENVIISEKIITDSDKN